MRCIETDSVDANRARLLESLAIIRDAHQHPLTRIAIALEAIASAMTAMVALQR